MKISIITVAYNMERTIGDTCRSIDGQTYLDWEHLILDGVSEDGTVATASRFDDVRRTVLSQHDEGIYDAMNMGVSRASGEVIGFLNADDFYDSSDLLERVADAFENSEIDIVYGNLKYVEHDNTERVVRDWVSGPYRKGMFKRGWMPPHPSVFVRASVFEEYGLFDRSFQICADWEWLYRVFEVHQLPSRYLPFDFVRMRVGGVSNRSLKNILASNLDAMRGFKKHTNSFPLFFFPGKLWHRGGQWIQALKGRSSDSGVTSKKVVE